MARPVPGCYNAKVANAASSFPKGIVSTANIRECMGTLAANINHQCGGMISGLEPDIDCNSVVGLVRSAHEHLVPR